jgi:hypothetical protein
VNNKVQNTVDCKIRTVTDCTRRDEEQGKCADNKEQKGVAGRVTSQLTNLIAVAVIAMPSLMSQALTQANRDCKIRTVTGRARQDEGQGKCTNKKQVKVVTWIRDTTIIQKTLTGHRRRRTIQQHQQQGTERLGRKSDEPAQRKLKKRQQQATKQWKNCKVNDLLWGVTRRPKNTVLATKVGA